MAMASVTVPRLPPVPTRSDNTSFPTTHDGDLNGDGVVNVADVLLAERILLGRLTPTQSQLDHGDVAPLVNGVPAPNGQFNLGDVLVIQRKALGRINFEHCSA